MSELIIPEGMDDDQARLLLRRQVLALKVGREVAENAGLDKDGLSVMEAVRLGAAEIVSRTCIAGEQAEEGDFNAALQTLGGVDAVAVIFGQDPVVDEIIVGAFTQTMTESF